MSFLRHITQCNTHRPEDFTPLVIAGEAVGFIAHHQRAVLADYPALFILGESKVQLTPTLSTPEERTAALSEVCEDLSHRDIVAPLRHEPYAVKQRLSSPELCRVDRVCAGFFGVRSWGVHLNGYRRLEDGSLALWVAKRAADRAVEPGKWDNMVAGGQPAGLSLGNNVVKEAFEEAGVPADLARRAWAVGAITYSMQTATSLRRDTLFCFDLEVDAAFQPVNTDGEVERFELWPLSKALDVVRSTTDFKYNVGLTIIDFAIRHGVLTGDNEADYEALLSGLRG